jgi:hypothetical protein
MGGARLRRPALTASRSASHADVVSRSRERFGARAELGYARGVASADGSAVDDGGDRRALPARTIRAGRLAQARAGLGARRRGRGTAVRARVSPSRQRAAPSRIAVGGWTSTGASPSARRRQTSARDFSAGVIDSVAQRGPPQLGSTARRAGRASSDRVFHTSARRPRRPALLTRSRLAGRPDHHERPRGTRWIVGRHESQKAAGLEHLRELTKPSPVWRRPSRSCRAT